MEASQAQVPPAGEHVVKERRPSPVVVVKALAHHYTEVAVSDSAAQISYYLMFALFPFLFFLVTLMAYLPIHGAVQDLLNQVEVLMPASAFRMVNKHLNVLITQPRPKLLTVGLLTTVYSASRGVDAMRGALNRAYRVTESRPFFQTQVTAIGVTLVGTGLLLLSCAGLVLGGRLGFWIANHFHVGTQYLAVWSYLRWPCTAAVVMMAAGMAYSLLPDVKQQLRFVWPGSLAASLFWMAAMGGMTFYYGHFGHLNAAYGSIGGVVLLLTWFYLSSVIFLMGGLLNVILEHSSADGKEVGARVAGEPAAPPEQRVLASTVAASKSKRQEGRLRRLLWRTG